MYYVENFLFLGEAAKKVIFFSGPTTKALTPPPPPPPLELSGHRVFFGF